MNKAKREEAIKLGFDPDKLERIEKRMKKAGIDGVSKIENLPPAEKIESIKVSKIEPRKGITSIRKKED